MERNNSWTEREIEILKQNYSTKSSTEIGALIGKSRNAVIGKAHRLGLSLYKVPPTPPQNRNQRPKLSVVADNTMKKFPAKRLAKPPTRLPVDVPLPTGANPIGIMELTINTCRAPVGRDAKGLVTYCGEDVFPGKVWCPGHCVLFFRPDQRRRSA